MTGAGASPDPIAAPETPLARWLYAVLFASGLGWTAYLALASAGAVLDDEIGHFLIAQGALRSSDLLLNLWGRPLNTAIYALPAAGGLAACRLVSVALSGAAILYATQLARRIGVRALFLIPAATWFQPWFDTSAYAVLPQIPFGLLLLAGTYYWAAQRHAVAALCFGMLPLVRHEGMALTALWGLYMLMRRDWLAAACTALPYAAFDLIYMVALGQPATAIFAGTRFPRRYDVYGSGDWLHFVRQLRYAVGLPVLALAAAGVMPLLRSGKAYLLTGFAVYFAVHVVVFRFGLFGSGGYLIFLLPLAPVFGLVAAMGGEWIARTGARMIRFDPRAARWASTALVSALLVGVIYAGVREEPLPQTPDGRALAEASAWLRSEHLADRPVIATHVLFFYLHGLRVTPDNLWTFASMKEAPPLASLPGGTIAVWDARYSERKGLELAALRGAPDWREIASFGPGGRVILFEHIL